MGGMRNLIIVGVVMLGVGFGIGWVSKPAPRGKAAAAVAAGEKPERKASSAGVREEKEAVPDRKRPDRPEADPDPLRGLTDEQRKEAKRAQEMMTKQVVKGFRNQFEQHLRKLGENFDLTDAQKESLTGWFESRLTEMDGLSFGDAKSMERLGELTKELTTRSLEEELAKSLDEDQKAALGEFQQKEVKSKADAKALKHLSKMQGVFELGEEQKDEVYRILAEQAEETVREQESNPDPSKVLVEGMGMDMDPYDLGLQQAVTEAFGDPMALSNASGSAGDREAMGKALKEAIDKRIDARVEALRPVLSEEQLAQYRRELQTKGPGVYGSMMMMGGTD